MSSHPYPSKVDLSEFAENSQDHRTKYGLPQDVKFCKRCVISNQRPSSTIEFKHTKESKKRTIHFDDEGVCDACRFAEKKATIDWADRDRELRALCDRHRKSDGSFDCIVPGSGGKDSFYVSHLLKYEYGMNPLTVTWAPHIYTTWGWHNFQEWIHSGFDNILYTPNGSVHRVLTRLAVENLFHPFQPFFFGQKSLAPKMSIKYNIPLVFYGENEAEYGNPIASANSPRQDWEYFSITDKSKVFLSGTSVGELKENYGISENELLAYMPADPEQLQKNGTEVHYFGYYKKWHPQSCYYYTANHCDFKVSPDRNPGTYSKYASLDDKIDDFNFITTFIKFGIGRASYDASQEIRSGDITREEGVALVEKFDGEYPTRFESDIFDYLSLPAAKFPTASKMFEQPVMDKEYFLKLADHFRSPHLWKFDGQWRLRHAVWHNRLAQAKTPNRLPLDV